MMRNDWPVTTDGAPRPVEVRWRSASSMRPGSSTMAVRLSPAAPARGATSDPWDAGSSAAGNKRWVRRRRAGATEARSAGVLGQVGLDRFGEVGRCLLGLGAVAGPGRLAQGGEVVLEADVEV